MNKQIIKFFAVIFAIYLNSAQAATLSVDMVPGANVDGSLTTTAGSFFDVNVLINDAQDLAGFQFELGFDSSILQAASIVSGNIFGADTFSIDSTINADTINFSELSMALVGNNVSTATLLATITFQAVGAGISVLDLNQINSILSDSIGDPISPVSINNGELISVAAVPVPGVIWLYGSGLIGLIGMAKRRSKINF